MLFTTRDIRRLTGLPLSTLMKWIAKGYIKPVYMGTKARGDACLFTAQQTIGLAHLSALRRTANKVGVCHLGGPVIKMIMADKQSISDRQLEALFRRAAEPSRADAHDQELAAQWESTRNQTPVIAPAIREGIGVVVDEIARRWDERRRITGARIDIEPIRVV
jgi:hypothetical protein